MSSAQIEIQLIAMVVAIACAIPGVFLVLRKMALISDAISHSILPGIVVGFLLVHDLNSPWLILLAALTGVITVVLVEAIQKTKLVKEDTAIGLVFPALFSIGVLLIARKANDVHLDVDAVLLGDLTYVAFDRVTLFGLDVGPKSLIVMGIILLITITLLILFFKELKISTFDIGLSASLGISPVVMHYGLMSVSSITVVGAFDAVGAILVVALMIAPAGAAYLLTSDLKKMLWISVGFGVFSAILGYWISHWLDASIAGSISSVLGLVFFMSFTFKTNKMLFYLMSVYLICAIPIVLYLHYRLGLDLLRVLSWTSIILVFAYGVSYGLIHFYGSSYEKRKKKEVLLLVFLLHLNNHNEESERHINHLNEHINWQKLKSKTVVELALKNNMISIENQIVSLTEKGREFTHLALEYIITNKDENIEFMKDEFFLFRG